MPDLPRQSSDARETGADRIRALASAEPDLRQCEIARRLGVTPQRVHDALKAVSCVECGRSTRKRGLCNVCADARMNIGECRYQADGVRVPLRDAEGNVTAWAIVNIDDGPAVARFAWSLMKVGYVHRRAQKREDPKRRIVLLHRAILGLEPGDPRQADHINGDRLDNRRENLRIVTHAQNAQNVTRRDPGSSRFRGVSFYKRDSVWVASVNHGGRNHYGGRFETEEEAAAAAAALRSRLYSHANESRPGHWRPPADSDHETVDAWRDHLAVPDPFEVDFEPVYEHGPVLPTAPGLTGLESPRPVGEASHSAGSAFSRPGADPSS